MLNFYASRFFFGLTYGNGVTCTDFEFGNYLPMLIVVWIGLVLVTMYVCAHYSDEMFNTFCHCIKERANGFISRAKRREQILSYYFLLACYFPSIFVLLFAIYWWKLLRKFVPLFAIVFFSKSNVTSKHYVQMVILV